MCELLYTERYIDCSFLEDVQTSLFLKSSSLLPERWLIALFRTACALLHSERRLIAHVTKRILIPVMRDVKPQPLKCKTNFSVGIVFEREMFLYTG